MDEPVLGRESFRDEARYQAVCAVCQKPGPYQAHHVLYEQVLDRLGLKGKALYDTRNALRICVEGVTNCHSRHHWKLRAIKTVELTNDNIAYAFEKLGAYAADWLRRYYDDTEPDPRIVQLESAE